MTRNAAYRNQPCGYCGQNTADNGHGEHVFPACMYPRVLTDSTVQRVKIPACPECNRSFQRVEAHTRNTLVACGLDATPERRELWEICIRSLRRKDGGKEDGLAILAQLAANDNANGHPQDPTLPASTSAPNIQAGGAGMGPENGKKQR